MQFLRKLHLIAPILLFALAAAAQQPATPKSSPPTGIDNDFIQKQFGDTCTLVPAPPPLKADLDGDGIEDIVIVARCRNPLPDQAEYNFKVVDPYNTYFGFGDPKVTTQFATEDPDRRGVSLLIIHGTGPEAWRAATPKAKFLIINLPFKQLRARKMFVKKKAVTAIYAEEASADDMTSTVFWDGRKYRYEPLGSNLE